MARIVIVDDASFMRGSLKFIIENSGHEVVGLGKSGADALELYKESKPDLMTLDILMKGGDGLAALKAIRDFDPNAKVLMVTAVGQEEKKRQAAGLGAAGYIRKPFKQSEVVTEIERVLGVKRGAGGG